MSFIMSCNIYVVQHIMSFKKLCRLRIYDVYEYMSLNFLSDIIMSNKTLNNIIQLRIHIQSIFCR